MNRNLLVLGAGAQGRIVAELCTQLGIVVAGFLDDTQAVGSEIDGVEVIGGFAAAKDENLIHEHVFCVALGEPGPRRRWCEAIEKMGGELVTLVHPRAEVSASAQIGRGCVVGPFATLFPGARIHDYVIIDNHASVGVDNRIGTASFVGPSCQLNSRVVCGAETFFGAGAVVVPQVRIGSGSLVGAGATVIRDVPDGKVVVGVPARVVRDHVRNDT